MDLTVQASENSFLDGKISSNYSSHILVKHLINTHHYKTDN